MADRRSPEGGFLDDVAVGEGWVDPPAQHRRPLGIGVTVGGVGERARLPVVGEPELRRRQVEPLGELDQGVMLARSFA
jgi:hypothetical protein